MTTKTPSNWVQLYFVLSSLLGLLLTAIGVMVLTNVILTQTVLKLPNQPYNPPPEPYFKTFPTATTDQELTPDQQEALSQWEADYQRWQEENQNYDYESVSRRRDLVTALSLLITGIPILLFHAPWVFRQR
jgi:hypothetical protein